MTRSILGTVLVLALAACGGEPAKKTVGAGSIGGSGSTGGGGASGLTTSGGASGSSGASCFGNDINVGAGHASMCCSAYVDANGFCAAAPTSTTGSAGSAGASGTTAGSSGSTGGGPSGSSGEGSTTGGTTTGGSGSSGGCYPNGLFVGAGGDAFCCSGYADSTGYCADPNATTTGGTTTSGGTTTTTTTTGGSSGSTGATCSAACYSARGYHCDNGQCVLNGGSGQLQVTLQWDSTLQTNGLRAREDLDLHVVEPNGCEIYYGNTNRSGTTSSCTAVGSLDLDQNAACSQTDNQGGYGNDTENVIYPSTGAPSGTYTVIVDDWTDGCDGNTPSPFNWQLLIRKGSQTIPYTGSFSQGSGDHSGALVGASNATGHKVFTFTYP